MAALTRPHCTPLTKWTPLRGHPTTRVRYCGALRAESVEGSEKAVDAGIGEMKSEPAVTRPSQMEYLTSTEAFSLAQVSFGTILAPIGVGSMVFGFCAYFDLIPG